VATPRSSSPGASRSSRTHSSGFLVDGVGESLQASTPRGVVRFRVFQRPQAEAALGGGARAAAVGAAPAEAAAAGAGRAASAGGASFDADIDPFAECPWFKESLLWLASAVVEPASPTTTARELFLYRTHLPSFVVMFIGLAGVVSSSFNNSFVQAFCNSLILLNYSLAPATFLIPLRHLVGVWRSLYRADAPQVLIDYRRRIQRQLTILRGVWIFGLVLTFLFWLYFVWTYVISVKLNSPALIANAVDSVIFGAYCATLFSGIIVTLCVQRTCLLLHECQVEILLRSFRNRTRSSLLCMAAPTAVKSIPSCMYEFFFGDYDAFDAGRPSLKAKLDDLAAPDHVPLSAMLDMYMMLQRSMIFTANTLTPMICVCAYGVAISSAYFFYQVFQQGIYSGAVFLIVVPLITPYMGLQPFASLNMCWEHLRKRIDSAMSHCESWRSPSRFRRALPAHRPPLADCAQQRPRRVRSQLTAAPRARLSLLRHRLGRGADLDIGLHGDLPSALHARRLRRQLRHDHHLDQRAPCRARRCDVQVVDEQLCILAQGAVRARRVRHRACLHSARARE
jgi:hypothetical protein